MPSHHLLCTLSPSLSLLLLFFFFFFFFSGSFHGVRSAFSTICDPVSSSFLCGNVPIRYPFWNDSDAPVHCGYPGLGLECPYGSVHPILSLPGEDYFVTDINYDDETLTLVDIDIDIDIDVAEQKCPRAHHNLTFGSLPLHYNSANVNLTFFFNCTAPPAVSIPHVPISCLRPGDNLSYVFVNKSPEEVASYEGELDCEETVVAAVKRKEVTAANLGEEFAGVMSEGFVLDWAVAKECGACENSGGRCAFNQNDHLLCFCNDETIHGDGSFCKGRNEVCVCSFSVFLGKWSARHD